MAWLILALGAVALYLVLQIKPDTGPEYDRKRLRGIQAGREQQRREYECKHGGGPGRG